MLDSQLYEYTVIRIVPRVERGEFINAGILLYSKKTNFLACRIALSTEKLLALDKLADVALIERQLEAFQRIAHGEKACQSPIAKLDKAARFRWLSANRSTIIQMAPIHPGYTLDLEHTIEGLINKLVR